VTFEFVEQGRPTYGPPAPVQIIQEEVDFAPLLDLYRERKPMRVLEVGTYTGGTFFHWLQNAQPGSVVVSVDMYEDADNTHLYDSWAPEGVTWHAIKGESSDEETVEAARALSPYDWIFIDAGHREHEVRADWENYGPMASPGGIVAFHDIAEMPDLPSIQVDKVWSEIKQGRETREILNPDTSGIGIVFV